MSWRYSGSAGRAGAERKRAAEQRPGAAEQGSAARFCQEGIKRKGGRDSASAGTPVRKELIPKQQPGPSGPGCIDRFFLIITNPAGEGKADDKVTEGDEPIQRDNLRRRLKASHNDAAVSHKFRDIYYPEERGILDDGNHL